MAERHRLVASAGMSQDKLAFIGAISILASHTEHYAELAIWALEGLRRDKRGNAWTDAKPISELIDKLDELATSVTHAQMAKLIREWCKAARLAFNCRNSIFHGRTWIFDSEWATFIRNEPIQGRQRKRPSSDFHASNETLNLLEEAFSYLLDGAHLIGVAAQTKVPLGDFKEPLVHVRRAGSIVAELHDLASVASHDKY